jgi:hypothetical protein
MRLALIWTAAPVTLFEQGGDAYRASTSGKSDCPEVSFISILITARDPGGQARLGLLDEFARVERSEEMKRRILIALVMVLVLGVSASVVWGNAGDFVSYWPFDEGSGSTAYDATANNNDGTINGATYTPDKAPIPGNDYSLAFDGNDYVQVPDSATLESANVTVAAWVKSTSPGAVGYVLAKGGSGCTAASYALYTGGSGGLYFYIFSGSSYKLSPNAGTSVWDGYWHHVAGTFDGSVVRLYVDGSEIGSGASTTIAIGYDLPTTDDFFVGAYRGSCNLHFNGLIDEVRMWDRALSADEIAALAAGVVEVDIDIKPGSDPNCFNHNGHGVIPVAILGTDSFDVTSIDPGTVALEGLAIKAVGKSNKLLASIEDVNGDGFDDLVVKIEDGDGVWDAGETLATVTGNLWDGTPIEGEDYVCITQ